ncbi:Uncharacterized protein DUF121 [Rhodovulum sp. PH10]|uniref:2-phospho-L-lactate guanylyltransferase n=1 Tax=Rhodovulum sp. PH10 TaxID=1187851 RepID=UPI00027C2354|nr:2-phospho-L-lactate guanylyltransferase [Rhodovulum sp. PH10]EJW12350.1 Uncharacterized protein DUF121 [Rhodovulum sp. PH10]
MSPAAIVVPCKGFREGKSRLAGCLDGAARRDLCRRLLARTLGCAAEVMPAALIRVVTADAEAAALAASFAVGRIADPGGGLNAALEHARTQLQEEMGTVDLVVLPIDLPLAAPRSIATALERPADVVIAPDRGSDGTNLMILRGASRHRLPFAYGPGSFSTHRKTAKTLGLTVETILDPRLAFDLDDPDHYASWLAWRDGPAGAFTASPRAADDDALPPRAETRDGARVPGPDRFPG